MSDFLTRRDGIWNFVRRVPAEYSAVDHRSIVRHSTRIKIVDDRNGRRAARVAQMLNTELERFWRSMKDGRSTNASNAYEAARRRARELGFDFVENSQLITQPLERILERLETLIDRGLVQDAGARVALLGTVKQPPAFLLSRLFDEYEAAVRAEIKDYSPDQLRIWKTARTRAVRQFVDVVGDKLVTDLTDNDGIEYAEWWRERVVNDEVVANRDIGQLSAMLKTMSVRRRLGLLESSKVSN